MPPHPMMPMAALYGMPGHPYGPAMSMPGGGEGRKANKFTHFTYSRRILGAPIGDIWSHNSATSSVSGGDVWPRRFSRRTGAPWQSRWARAGRRAGWSDCVEIQADPNILHFQLEPKSLHASMASLAQSHHQHHGPPMPHHHRMVLGENG